MPEVVHNGHVRSGALLRNMDLKCQTASTFSCLLHENLSAEWADLAWNQNFSEKVSLPDEVPATVDLTTWQDVLVTGKKWLNLDAAVSQDDNSDNFWIALMSSEISHKILLPYLVHALDVDKKNDDDFLRALTAARLYAVLLQIPGSSAFKIFQPLVFQRVIDQLRLLQLDDHQPDAPKDRSRKRSSPRKKKGRRGKKRPQSEDEEESESSLLAEEMEVSAASQTARIENKAAIERTLKLLMVDLVQCLGKVSLREQEALRYHLVSTVLRLLPGEVERSAQSLDFRQPLSDKLPLSALAWFCLRSLCSDLHGDKTKLTTEVFNQLLPVVMMLGEGGTPVQQLNAPLERSSRHALDFIRELHLAYGAAVELPIKTLIQHVCVKVPDKAEYRAHLSDMVVTGCLEMCSQQLFVSMMDWIYKFSRNTKVGYRLFALEVVLRLLTRPPLQPSPAVEWSPEERSRFSPAFLLKIVLSRCSDKSASVRTKALSSLAKLSSHSSPELTAAVLATVNDQLVSDGESAGSNMIYPMLGRRAVDEKVLVRKAAIAALEGLIRLDPQQMSGQNVAVLRERCQDPGLSVRKQALLSLTALTMDNPQRGLLHSYWLDGVLPMVMDRESSIQEICADLMEDVLLKSIRPYHKEMEEHEVFVWSLLRVLAEQDDGQEMRRHLKKVCQVWHKQGRISPSLVRSFMTHADPGQENAEAAWMMLSEFVTNTKELSCSFLESNWQLVVPNLGQKKPFLTVCVLNVASVLCSKLSAAAKERCIGDLCQLLGDFRLSPQVIVAAMETLIKVFNEVPQGEKKMQQFCLQLMGQCEEYITRVLKMEVEVNERALIAHLFTLGEISQLCPSQTSEHTCYIVQGLLLSSGGPLQGMKQLRVSQSTTTSSSSSQQQQPLLPPAELTVSPIVRAHGYITLGKLCLQHEDVLKKCLLQMVQEMELATTEAVRNNIVLVLCDLIVRYPTRVDNYIPSIAACLRDRSVLVRRQTLTLLTGLLQEDYIKWKGILFYRFVLTLIDEDEEIRRYAEFCFCHILLVKHPGMFYAHFLDCLFHFNCYENHKNYNRFKQSERERELFSLKGPSRASKRMKLYLFFLENITDEHRFQLAAKLCQEVLGSLVDGSLPLNDNTSSIVKDTLQILTSKEIKLRSLSRNVAEDLADEGDVVGAAVEAARTKLISQIVRKNVIENIVPTIVATKHLFERMRSPLLRNLMLFLKEVMKDYKEELNDVMAADPQLAEEIRFDLKKFEEAEQHQRLQRTPAAVLTPHGQAISPLLTPGVLGTPAAVVTAKKAARILTPPQLSLRRTAVKRAANLLVTPLATHHCAQVGTGAGGPRHQGTPFGRGVAPSTSSAPAPRPLGLFTAQHMPAPAPPPPPPSFSSPPPQPSSSPATVAAAARTPGPAPPPPVAFTSPQVAGTLAQAAVLASVRRNEGSLVLTPHKAPIPPEFSTRRGSEQVAPRYSMLTSETIVEGGFRTASTPHNVSQAVSFNVSSQVPPSPILMRLTNENAEQKDSNAPPKKREKTKSSNADIVLKEPSKHIPWKVDL